MRFVSLQAVRLLTISTVPAQTSGNSQLSPLTGCLGPTDSEGPAQMAQMVTLISHDHLNTTVAMEPYTVLQLHPGTNLILICLSTLCRIMMRIGLMYYLMDILSGFVPGGNE